MDLFLVAAFVKPTVEDAKKGVAGKIVLPLTLILAPDAEKARLKAAKGLPEDLPLDRLEVRVRPF